LKSWLLNQRKRRKYTRKSTKITNQFIVNAKIDRKLQNRERERERERDKPEARILAETGKHLENFHSSRAATVEKISFEMAAEEFLATQWRRTKRLD
jgi:hypothetical protein